MERLQFASNSLHLSTKRECYNNDGWSLSKTKPVFSYKLPSNPHLFPRFSLSIPSISPIQVSLCFCFCCFQRESKAKQSKAGKGKKFLVTRVVIFPHISSF